MQVLLLALPFFSAIFAPFVEKISINSTTSPTAYSVRAYLHSFKDSPAYANANAAFDTCAFIRLPSFEDLL